ncbi:non-ribosomal peptide synthetase, partial [Duganella rhizosphaerae]|uniref:non-ribosomal peptide synthetase n=1 Tax=Duganella rhizosphaerae TaxID=2885763 RepID=UPI00403FB6E9
LLAILKAGAAYVPVDPAYPADRIAHMLADSAPVAVLTQQSLRQASARLRTEAAAPQLVCIDDPAIGAAGPAHNPTPHALGLRACHLAYLIYTSGSTGLPKGVMIEHRNACNMVAWARDHFTPAQLARTLFCTSINFDLAVYEMFVPLSAGGTLVIARDILDETLDLDGVTHINTVPSTIATLAGRGRIPASVRSINLAGEALKRELVETLFATTEVEQVANLYGPSETTTYSTWIGMQRQHGFQPYIGRPLANTQIYLLDSRLAPVPLGVAGELYIGGAGVARGYLNRPELTAERFIADPFSADPHARLYKTGDLGRYAADGNIEYLGRNDFQVKLRGFRIELGEIETALVACAGVREAVVAAREDHPGDQRLVAYLLAHDGAMLDAAGLRAALAATLPGYMVPAAFVTLAAYPRTPNGKLDRMALPAPDHSAVATRTYAAPQGPDETVLAAIWGELLGLERIGRHDHFFELGGHSLLALQLMSRIREQCQVAIPLRALFDAPVFHQFSAMVTAAQIARFADHDIDSLSQKLDGLSETELLALLSEGFSNE